MADSVVHVEIEDVLESVRRLVAEDAALDPLPLKSAEVCFVLTPAHRIEDQKAQDVGADEPVLAADTGAQSQQPLELEALLNEVSRKTPHRIDETVNTDFGDLPTALQTDPSSDTPANYSASEYQSMAEAWKKELASGDIASESPESAVSSIVDDLSGTTLEDRIAELEAAVSRSREDWEPDGSEPSRKPEIHRHIYEVVDNTKTAATVEPDLETPNSAVASVDEALEESDSVAERPPYTNTAEPETEVPEIPQMPSMGRGATSAGIFVLSGQISEAESNEEKTLQEAAEMEPMTNSGLQDAGSSAPTKESKAVSPIFSHTEPGENGPLMLVHPVKSEDDSPEIDAGSESANNTETPLQFSSRNAEVVPEDDVFLDVEALRTMIGELVRDELRGKMGERITHNVRQMVRQEIDRALLKRDDS